MEIKIYFTSEFETACDILYWKPEEILQEFINLVSLAKYNSQEVSDNEGLATKFMLYQTKKKGNRLVPAKQVHIEYCQKLKEIQKNYKENSLDERHAAVSKLFSSWRKELIMNMSEKDFIINVKERKKQLGID
ncbi:MULTISPECIES: hypothetical protein [Olivibacter]|jgi:hypothetical protein|uniref:Uncharacterized protein n=1 Tax=Olivibacter oleidegradans TaxID=760123 RepID=A0ABV6HEL2_9SPHI|nr:MULTISPECIES: hypothetical protein [Olivibacter]MDM8177372.1 hypothetical protein [Olivibacter sp. 47]QEK99817.1 hypothetical protein FKG96_03045 [Olivibacter sp. LS-1]